MSLDKATVARIAHLARLKLGEDEQAHLATELGKIMQWVEQLDEVDVVGVEPMTSVTAHALRWRPDAVTDGDQRADILANAPDASGAFFTVPKVVE